MADEPRPGTRQYRENLRAQLRVLGFADDQQIAERVAAELVRVCGKRPREAWRLARELSLDEVAARYNVLLDDPRAPMRKSRISDFERWPDRGVRPVIRTLSLLAQIYGTTWDRLVDLDDLSRFPASDQQVYQAAIEAVVVVPEQTRRLVIPAQRPRSSVQGRERTMVMAPVREFSTHSGLSDVQFGTGWKYGGTFTQEEAIMAAARESGSFGRRAARTNLGPFTLEQFDADIRRIVTAYPHQPVFPTFLEVLELRDAAFELLEGQQYPEQTRDLYLIAGILCGILANASFDLGHLAAAATQARTAYQCADLAGSNWLRAWVLGMQSLVAYWDNQFADAAALAMSGSALIPESGSAAVRLASIEARAHARLGDAAATQDALARACDSREATNPNEPFGGMLAFPEEKQLFYSATCNVWLPGQLRQAEGAAAEAVGLYEQAAPHQRRTGELLLARLDLASAHLGLDDPHAAADEIRQVITAGTARRTDSVRRRLQQLGSQIGGAPFVKTAIANYLHTEITDYCAIPTAPALPEGISE